MLNAFGNVVKETKKIKMLLFYFITDSFVNFVHGSAGLLLGIFVAEHEKSE